MQVERVVGYQRGTRFWCQPAEVTGTYWVMIAVGLGTHIARSCSVPRIMFSLLRFVHFLSFGGALQLIVSSTNLSTLGQ